MDEYAERDWDIDPMLEHYAKHVDAMTQEGLHSKSDIAAELAYRDLKIEQLQATNRQLVEALEKISGLCERRHNRLVNLERVLSEIAVTTNGAITNAKQQEKG